MIMFRTAVRLTIFSLLFFSCQKEMSYEGGAPRPPIETPWEFTESGSLFNGDMDTASLITSGTIKTLLLTGTDDQDGLLTLQIVAQNLLPGTYQNPNVLFQYSVGGSVIFENNPTEINSFSITITTIDDLSVTGTFSGLAQDGEGNVRIIEEGKFTAAFREGDFVNEETGKLTVWTKSLCSDGLHSTIIVNEITKDITDALPAEPECNDARAVVFDLPAGDYTVKAVCGLDTISYQVTITANNCRILEVSFVPEPDYFPLGNIWTYGNTLDPDNDTALIRSGNDTIINGDLVKSFVNETSGKIKYYAKSDGEYYEYIVSVPTAGDLLTPVKLLIMRDGAAQDDTWESDPYVIDFSASGIPITITAKIVNTVTRAGFTETFNGVTYTDLVEVTSALYTQETDGSWTDSASGYRTIFAKGIGIVFYQELNTGTDWTIRHYEVTPD